MEINIVLWGFPPNGWAKYNENEASLGNSVISSLAFFRKNDKRDIEYVEGASIHNITNTVTEDKAILERIRALQTITT